MFTSNNNSPHRIESSSALSLKEMRRTCLYSKPIQQECQQKKQKQEINEWLPAGGFNIYDCYNLSEVQSKYGISETALQNLIKRNSIPKIKKGWFAYVPKVVIDKLLS